MAEEEEQEAQEMREWFKQKGVLVAFGTVVALIATAAINGIIGNRADEIFQLMLNGLSGAFQHDALPWTIVVGVVVLAVLSIGFCWLQISVLQVALKRTNKMIALDGSLLRLLASWQPSQPGTRQVERLLKDVLLDATNEFDGTVSRAAILVPDVKGEFLRYWVGFDIPQESLEDMEFYIGKDQLKRERDGGIAGEVFTSGRLLVGHMKRIDNFWVCDLEMYKKPRGRRPFPPYRSLVSVPIMGSDPEKPNSTRCLGVLCFDSYKDDAFDSQDVKEVLLMLVSRVAAVILISEKLIP